MNGENEHEQPAEELPAEVPHQKPEPALPAEKAPHPALVALEHALIQIATGVLEQTAAAWLAKNYPHHFATPTDALAALVEHKGGDSSL